MKLADFLKLRQGLQVNAAPVVPRERQALLGDLRKELLESRVFEEIEVDSSDDLRRLLLALLTFPEEVSDREVVRAVEKAWVAVAFRHWNAHAFILDDGHVELLAAALDRPAGYYVSVHLVAKRMSTRAPEPDAAAVREDVQVPTQRRGEEPASASVTRTE